MARILVCDDSKLIRRIIADILKSGGHEIIGEAKNGEEAVEKFIQLKPDIITMDILMQPDGHEAIKKIITTDPKARVLIITSMVNKDGEVVETVRLGAKGFVAKPVNTETLLAEIERIIKDEKIN